VTLASASTASRDTHASDKQSTQVIQLGAQRVQEAQIDLGEQGDSLGDQIIFSEDLLRDGKKIGHDGGVCTIVGLVPDISFTVQCVTTPSLPRGLVTVHGLVTFTDEDRPFLFTITGGTGAYKTAHGQMKINFVPAPGVSRYTLFLVP
jgi:hypothetical protein